MADPISVAYETIALLSEKAQEYILGYHKSLEEIKQFKISVELCRQKFQLWQETWSGQVRNPDAKTPQSDVTSKALWGAEGWENIQKILGTINLVSRELEAALLKLEETAKSPPRTKWKAAVHALRSKSRSQPRSKDQDFKELAATLDKSVDELWLYTEAVFDSLHGVMTQEIRIPSRETLLESALQSRAGSLELHSLCARAPVDWSLEMNLLDSRTIHSNLLHEQDNSSLHPSYRLFTQTRSDPIILHKIVVENAPGDVFSLEQKSDVVSPAASKLQTPKSFLRLFYQTSAQTHDIMTGGHSATVKNAAEGCHNSELKAGAIKPTASEPQISRGQIDRSRSGDSTEFIPVASKGSGSPSFLRISIESTNVRLKSRPETLPSVLELLDEATNNLSVYEHLSIGAKVELAYKVVECGFFLLGTPWFSSLKSKNILRLKSIGEQRHKFILRVQTLEMDDLLFDDAEALTETSQLHRIGVLLMEIALDTPEPALPTGDYEHGSSIMSLLPFVEQNMGAQYCKATAFCLQYPQQQARFPGLSKYENSHFQDWTSYLAAFLQDYHSQVFLRLEELREIDTTSEYRSRKSLQID